MLDKKILYSLLPDTEIVTLEVADSTNLTAKQLSDINKHNILVSAQKQLHGVGRQGKTFFSPLGGLYFSLAVFPRYELPDIIGVTSAAAVAVAETIEEMTDLKPKIKWVNDIYIGGKKVCGILCQSVFDGGKFDRIIVGIGINIKPQNFPDEISSTAGSLGVEIDENILTAEIAKKILKFCANLTDKTYLEYYRESSCVIGNEIIFYENGAEHFGKAVGIDDNAALIVEENGTRKKLSSGEITVRIKNETASFRED